MISISHSPNSTITQQLKALGWLIFPWRWFKCKTGSAVKVLEEKFKQDYQAVDAFSFSQAREGLYAILKALELKEGDEVLLQAFTCIVVPNSILWTGAKPVYCDVDQSLNIDPVEIEKKITSRTKAVIVQHAFGVPADLARIKSICESHNLILIEDCALSLGAKVSGKSVGSYGDVAFFSFGRDKVISSVSGGMVIAKNAKLAENIAKIYSKAAHRSYFWIFQNLMHILIVPGATALMGRLKIGQILLRVSQLLGLVNKVYQTCEKQSEQPSVVLHRLPNSMADLAWQQLGQLQKFNDHRIKLARVYTNFCKEAGIKYQQVSNETEPIFLRFAIFVDRPNELIKSARKRGVLLGDWYASVVVPAPSDLKQVAYKQGDAPQAEKYAQGSVNLPTHHKMKEKHVQKVLAVLTEHKK